MATVRHLNHAPIREAVIDIAFASERLLDEVEAFARDAASPDGGEVVPLHEAAYEIVFDGGEPSARQVSGGTRGWRIQFPDGLHVVQLRPNRFTFSRLAPYASWGDMSARAQSLWSRFLLQGRVNEVNRLAVRFINRIQVGPGAVDLDDYFRGAPHIPAELPQALAEFLVRWRVVDGDDMATVTQLYEGKPEPRGTTTVVVDIDAVHVCSMKTLDCAAIEGILNRLRSFKNDLFFGLVTDKALEPYE